DVCIIATVKYMIRSGKFADEMRGGIGTCNKIVAYHILEVVGGGVAAYEAHHAPVVYHVVDVFNSCFCFGVAALVVDPEAMMDGYISRPFKERTEALRVYRF